MPVKRKSDNRPERQNRKFFFDERFDGDAEWFAAMLADAEDLDANYIRWQLSDQADDFMRVRWQLYRDEQERRREESAAMTPTRAEVVAALKREIERGSQLVMAEVGGTLYWLDRSISPYAGVTIKQADENWNWTPAVFAPEPPKVNPS